MGTGAASGGGEGHSESVTVRLLLPRLLRPSLRRVKPSPLEKAKYQRTRYAAKVGLCVARRGRKWRERQQAESGRHATLACHARRRPLHHVKRVQGAHVTAYVAKQ